MDEYKSTASFYDSLLYLALNKIRKKVLKTAQLLETKRIIDLCCGTGNQLKMLQKNGFQQLTGVDISEAMLKIAAQGTEPAPCMLQDATHTELETGSFDLAIISFALHEKPIPTAKKILAEAIRLIEKDGYLIVVDYNIDKKRTWLGKWGINWVEYLAGVEHYRNFKQYIQAGGLFHLMGNIPVKLLETNTYHLGATRFWLFQILK